jgi:uncharacterized protein (DUF433 family)
MPSNHQCTDDLIRRHIADSGPSRLPDEARLVEEGVPVWIIIGFDLATHGDTERVADTYRVSTEAVEAARAYYRQHHDLIDARLQRSAAYFAA